jgi:peptidoglycan/xylan/chitin deacetylase (PgdA/CDA1 family)
VTLSEADRVLRSGRVSAPTVVLTFDDGYADNFISLRAVAEETGTTVVMFVATQPIEDHREFSHDLAAATKGFFPLTWDQIQHWNRRAVEFGSHTRNHADCGTGDRTLLEAEIIGSRQDLEVRCGRSAGFFAFPFGKPKNMSAQAMHIAASTYSIFLSAFGGENLPCKDGGRQHLLRKGLYSHPWELELDMQSVFDLVQNSKLRIKRSLGSLPPAPAAAKS